MECEVRYYGMIGEKLGFTMERINLNLDLKQLKDLNMAFIQRHPQLKEMMFKVAVDNVICNEIKGSEVRTIALLPPFAGG